MLIQPFRNNIPAQVAVTGVKGLKTIVPCAGIASWYSYSNSQGVCVFNSASYTDFLAGSCSGGTFLDKELEIQDRRYWPRATWTA